jgi:acetyltransferase-like isoleucine patch superfamily enzyme
LGCYIDDGCVVSARVILKDFVYIEKDSVVPSDMVIPPFSIVTGNPAIIVGEVPESLSTLAPRDAVTRYRNFKAIKLKS